MRRLWSGSSAAAVEAQSNKSYNTTTTNHSSSTASVLLTSLPLIAGQRVVTTVGLVAASAVRTRALPYDLLARIVSLFGGEVGAYSDLMVAAARQATERLQEEAQRAGANAVIGVTLSTHATADPISGIYIYVLAQGTAVRATTETNAANTKD